MSDFMLGLIHDLLEVTQLESGKSTLELRPEDLRQVVYDSVEMNRVLADQKQIRIAFDIGGPLPLLALDRGKIEQVLNNLLGNALKFSYPDSEITVRLEREPRYAAITITDQGQGIPADEIGKLFKSFSRTSVRSTAGESSTGLGLSIVRHIVERHGGKVEVESEVGRGSSFCVRLPWNQPNADRQGGS